MKQLASFVLGVIVSASVMSLVVATQAHEPVIEVDPLEGWCYFAEFDSVREYDLVINKPKVALVDVTSAGVIVYERCASI